MFPVRNVGANALRKRHPLFFGMRDSFVFMKQWREGLRTLPATEQAEAFNAIVDYALEGKPYAGKNPAIKMFMALITAQIDEHNAKYSEVCEKRANAARRRWEDANASQSIQKDANAIKSSHLHTDNDSDSDCDSDNVSDKSDNKKNTAKRSIEKRTKFDIQSFLIDKGVEREFVDAWLQIRKNKRATNSEAAMDLIDRQIQLAGITWNEAVQECVLRNWIGFKADWWYKDHPAKPSAEVVGMIDLCEQSKRDKELIRQMREARGQKQGKFDL